MTTIDADALRAEVIRELFDLRGEAYAARGGGFDVDLHPLFNALRDEAPIHPGTPGELVGYDGPSDFPGLPMPDRPHFTVFDFDTCKQVLHNQVLFSASEHEPGTPEYENQSIILFMDGRAHRRLRGLVQPAFMSSREGWWVDNWIADTVDQMVGLIESHGRADLNVEFFAAIPLLTICRSYGVGVADALEIRRGVLAEYAGLETMRRLLMPIIVERRGHPRDDLISVLVHAELTDEEDGSRHQLSDDDVLLFSVLLLAAGSGTTWKQLGITMLTLLQHPAWLDQVTERPDLMDAVIEESMRWLPTDPAFARFATQDTELHGIRIPKGSVIHLNFSSANRDPSRWERPDEFDPGREHKTHLGFGAGVHVCLGRHVARAEMRHAITALLRRLPGLRLDPAVDEPRVIGMYERGPTSVPVLWDPTGRPPPPGQRSTR